MQSSSCVSRKADHPRCISLASVFGPCPGAGLAIVVPSEHLPRAGQVSQAEPPLPDRVNAVAFRSMIIGTRQLRRTLEGVVGSYRGDNSMIRPRSDGFGLPASTAISSLPLGS